MSFNIALPGQIERFDAPGFDLEGYIKTIQNKAPSSRTRFENQVIGLYEKANKEGTEFCIRQLKDKALKFVSDNKFLVLIIAATIVLILVKKIK